MIIFVYLTYSSEVFCKFVKILPICYKIVLFTFSIVRKNNQLFFNFLLFFLNFFTKSMFMKLSQSEN